MREPLAAGLTGVFRRQIGVDLEPLLQAWRRRMRTWSDAFASNRQVQDRHQVTLTPICDDVDNGKPAGCPACRP